jgi:hypothetical protein
MSRISKRRQDLVSFQKVINIKEALNLRAGQLADMLGVSQNQYSVYNKEGHLPIFRFQSLVNALRLAIIEEQQQRLQLLDSIINSNDDD